MSARFSRTPVTLAAVGVVAMLTSCRHAAPVAESRANDTSPLYEVLRDDTITNADVWDAEPKMLAAGLGFTSIIGVPDISTDQLGLSQTRTRLAGGAWNDVHCADGVAPQLANYTSAATPTMVRNTYGQDVYYSDGLPIEFSWPLLPSTLDATDFVVELNDGSRVTPQVASVWPNFEYNERSVAVVFGHFGNRVSPRQPGAIYATSVEVVADETPLQLIGPREQQVSAVGLRVDAPGSPYTDPGVAPHERGGPKLVGAKLSRMSTVGDSGPRVFQQNLPNDGTALYGDEATYRLRVYTSGGMTPDGVRGLFPTDYERFFRVNVQSADGTNVQLTTAGTDYVIDGARVRVVGLADLGVRQDSYDDCYIEDKDNYIDIILDGDEAAVRNITTVEIPSTDAYAPLYNPGGPGNDPAPGVRYSAPSPPISQPVMLALDDPMTVSYTP